MKPAVHDRASATDGPASAREEERRRLARDLHDGPAQTLAAALFGVDLAVSALDRAPATARDEFLARAGAGAGCAGRRAGTDGRVAAASSRAARARRRPEWAGRACHRCGERRCRSRPKVSARRAVAGGCRARALPHLAGGGQQRAAAWRSQPRPGVARGKAGRSPSCWLSTMDVVSRANRICLVQQGRGTAWHARACGASGRRRCGSSPRRAPGRGSR